MTTKVVTRPRGRSVPGDLRRTVRLFRRFMGSPKPYVLGVLLLGLEAATAVVEPYPIAYLIDFLQNAKPSMRELGGPVLLSSVRYETILLLTLAIVLIAAVNSAADSLTEVCMARGGRSLGYSVRVALYSHLQRLPLGYHDRRRTGDVLTRVTGDVLVLEDFVVKSVSNILGSLLVLLGSFAFLAYQSWNVALVALVVVPLLALVANYFSRRIKVASKTQRDREGDLASTAQEMLTSIRLVQSYGRGKVDLDRFADQTARSMHASLGAANIQAQFSFVIALVEALSISAVVWLGVWLVDRNAITIGTLVLFVLLLQNMFKPARKIVSEWYKIGKVFASVERIEELLDREVVVRDLPDAVPAPPLSGRLTFRHVGFSYPGEQDGTTTDAARVLDDIDFEAAPGEVVALVGFSGAGKSTIAQLVPRLYDPDEGEVLVDGIPLRSLTLASLRSQVSLVLQETVLLSGTVAENIGYGIDDATPEEIEMAARMANAHDFIMGMPEGYATKLGERGSTLSGGQRQRLAIARAFIRQAPILILDEPTTGLDTESAQSVVGALRSLMRDTTTIVISHDPALVRSADRVLVIAGGRIVESGDHESLLRAGGAYADLYAQEYDLHTTTGPRSRPAYPTSWVPDRGDKNLAGRLRARLRDRLPGLDRALDGELVAEQVGRLLLDGDRSVESVSAGKVWLREDGTCTLRYQLRLADTLGDLGAHCVMGRLHPSDPAAEAYVRKTVGRLPDVRSGRAPSAPWRTAAAVVDGVGLALHPFPLDPGLPTLAQAMDPAVLARLLPRGPGAAPPTVELVHHPREGACVLRYRLSAADGAEESVLYGKVYGDAGGDVVDGFLRALAAERTGDWVRRAARFPRPVTYVPDLRLLVTEALPGEPLVPQLLKRVAAGADTPDVARLLAAVRASGEALAVLHGSDLATAPVRPAYEELAALHRELQVTGDVWPDLAAEVRHRAVPRPDDLPEPPDMVLSHGDFTPSQVIIGKNALAIVDLDTLCWADPALDLGRFLAHLDLVAGKLGALADSGLVDDLAAAFLGGYGGSTSRAAAAASATDRIAFYRRATLARSALHACRQLKSHRLEVAMSLLDSVHAQEG